MRDRLHSLESELNTSGRVLMAVLLIPAVISLAAMVLYAATYGGAISRMERVAALKPVVADVIPEQAWSVVAGRESFSECGVYGTIEGANAALEQLAGQGGSMELTVARRTMDTLAAYVRKIEQDMGGGVPVVQSEATLEEVRAVAALVDGMLDDYITKEIANVSAANKVLVRTVAIAAAVEIALLAAALCIAVRARKRMVRFIHESIDRLERFVGQIADGNLRARAPAANVAELANLTDHVNVMAVRLETLIEQNRREQENLKKAELRTLQAQINPHFLYNTLDTIVWQAEAGKTDEVILLTKALSDFFRISLSSGADWIPVAQEARHLLGYLAIQKTRYRDILDYSVCIDPEINGHMVLKLLLQPLVENALYHGIKHKRGGGTITVTGRAQGGTLVFEVRDNGRGMSEQQLRAVREQLRSDADDGRLARAPDSPGAGFGLRNVDQRIRLYYNQPEGLTIESGAGGTCVRFRVPIHKSEGA